MKDFTFTTEQALHTTSETLHYFLDVYFYEVFDYEAQLIHEDGSYAEVEGGDGKKWAVHAMGDGDFISHRVKFELINQ